MAEVVSLSAWKDSQVPHASGPARCLHCGHEWVAVAPVGVDFLECPACGLEKGVYFSLMTVSGEDHWACRCGGKVFGITPKSIYCVKCGLDQQFPTS